MVVGDAACDRRLSMLAEKFFLLLETIRSHTDIDGAPRIVSRSRHVPIELPGGKFSKPNSAGLRLLVTTGAAAAASDLAKPKIRADAALFGD
jgi:hypothetical protein